MSSDHPNKGHTPPAKKDDHTTTTTTTNKNDEEQPSLLSRIQNSASNLIQDSLAKPSGTALSSDLAHVLDSGNKASSFPASSSAASTWAAGSGRSSNALGNGGSSLNAHDEYTSRMDGGFRSAQSDRARALDVSEFDAFQSTGGFFQGDQDELFQENSSKGKGKEKSSEQRVPNAYGYIQDYEQDMTIDINDEYESSYFSAYEMAWINASRLGTVYRSTTSTPSKRLSQTSQSGNRPSTAHSQIRHENENDGAEVVTLLTDPSFQPGLGAWDDETAAGALNTTYGSGSGSGLGFDLDLADDPLDIEGFPRALAQSLSPAEMQVLDLFRKHHAQYPHQTTQEQSGEKRITAYSLIPDIDSFLAQNDNTSARNSMTDGALRNEVISNLIGAEEWLNVDERYNDEVWGYLRPAVEAAAAEIKEKEQNPAREGNDGDGPAVKRLKMILRHMARL